MEYKDELVYSIITRIADQTTMPIKDLRKALEEEMYDYSVSEIVSTELVTTDGQATEELLNYFANGKRNVNNAEGSIVNMCNVARNLVKFVGKELPLIQSDEICDFIKFMQESGKWTDVTAEGKRLYLSSVYSYLYNHEKIPSNPMVQVDPIKCVVKYKVPLTGYEIERIRMACEKKPDKARRRDLLLVMMLYDTGCRCSELANVKMEDVDLINRTILVTKTKNKRQRLVCYSEATQARLEDYFTNDREDIEISGLGIKYAAGNTYLIGKLNKGHGKLSKEAIEKVIKGLRNDSGVTRITPHYFRSACVLKLSKSNVSEPVISKYVGHEKRESLKNYFLVAPEEVQQIVARAI